LRRLPATRPLQHQPVPAVGCHPSDEALLAELRAYQQTRPGARNCANA